MTTNSQQIIDSRRATAKRLLTIGLLAELTLAVFLGCYWAYLRSSPFRLSGLVIQILVPIGIVAAMGFLVWLAWRLNRLRFSLRTMMVAFVCIGALLAVLIPQLRHRMAFQQKLAAYLDAEQVIDAHNGERLISTPTGYLNGKKNFTAEEMVVVDSNIHHQVTFTSQRFADEELAQLALHPNLQVITLIDCQFSKNGLLSLSRLKTLTLLDLSRQKVDRAWIEVFKKVRPDCTVRQ